MRITIVNQYYRPDVSPTAQLAAGLAEHRAELGDEVTIVTSAARYAGPRSDDPSEPRAGLKVYRSRAPRRSAASLAGRLLHYLLFAAGAAWRLARLPRQDVIICLTTPPWVAVLAACHTWLHRRTRLVLWNMDCYPDILEAVREGRLAGRAV